MPVGLYRMIRKLLSNGRFHTAGGLLLFAIRHLMVSISIQSRPQVTSYSCYKNLTKYKTKAVNAFTMSRLMGVRRRGWLHAVLNRSLIMTS